MAVTRSSPTATAVPAAAAEAAPARAWPSPLLRFAHLAVLWGFAAVQPLFADLGRNAEFFVARDNTAGDILIFAFVMALAVPLAALLVELLLGAIWAPLGRGAHVLFVGALAGLFALGVLKRADAGTYWDLMLAAAIGTGVALAYLRVAAVRSFFSVLSPAPAIFLALFLLGSPVSQLVLPGGGGGGGTAQAAVADSETPVVLVVFDELPAMTLMDAERRIDPRSVPSFARLARSATWYRNATTVADGTYVAVPPILTGHRPDAKIPTARSYPHSVFTLLGDHYDQHVLEPITHVCPDDVCHGARMTTTVQPQGERLRLLASDLWLVERHLLLPERLTRSLPPIDRDYEDFGGAERGVPQQATAADVASARRATGNAKGILPIVGSDMFSTRLRDAQRYIANIRPMRDGRPPLYMAHMEVPHAPWRLLPSGRQYPVEGPSQPGLGQTSQQWTRNRFLVFQGAQRHYLQAGFADHVLGQVIDRLKATGLWSKALVIVTADHGNSLRPGPSRRPVTKANYPEIANVPLFVKLPGQRDARIDDEPARTVDILPTIAAVVGAKPFADVDGVSLTGAHPPVTPSVRNGRRAKYVSMPFARFVAARDRELRRLRRLLPHGVASVDRSGPSRGLVGRSAAAVRPSASAQPVVEGTSAFRRVVPSRGIVPVYVTGHFAGGGRPGQRIAIAVNGRVRAVGEAYSINGQLRFSAIVPARSFRRGANDVRALALG